MLRNVQATGAGYIILCPPVGGREDLSIYLAIYVCMYIYTYIYFLTTKNNLELSLKIIWFVLNFTAEFFKIEVSERI